MRSALCNLRLPKSEWLLLCSPGRTNLDYYRAQGGLLRYMCHDSRGGMSFIVSLLERAQVSDSSSMVINCSRSAFSCAYGDCRSRTNNTRVLHACGPSRGLRLLAARAVHYSATLCAILPDGMETVGMLGGGKGGRYRPHRRTESSTRCHRGLGVSSVLTQNRNRAAGAVV